MASLFSREMVRRILALALLCVALAAIPDWGWVMAAIPAIAGMVLYLAVPEAHRPQSALVYERLPAVYGPDMLAFLLVSVFFALPFWARMGERYMWEDFGPLVHPSALLSWPLALISLAIVWFSAHYAAFWLVIENRGLRIHRLSGERLVPFSTIAEVRPFRRGLPKWLRWLVPILVVMGRPGASGAILLARDTTGVRLALDDGSTIDIPQEAFETNLDRTLSSLRAANVPIAPALQNLGKKRSGS